MKKRRLMVEVGDIIVINQEIEVQAGIIVEKGTCGKVLDETVPYYFLVKLFENSLYWIDGKYLDVIE